MFERLMGREASRPDQLRATHSTKVAMETARGEATRLGHEYVGTEHLALGLLASGTAGHRLIRSLGPDPQALRTSIELRCPPGRVHKEHLPYTSRVKRTFEFAWKEAALAGLQWVDVEYLLLGILLEEKGVGAQVLMHEGRISVHAVRELLRNPTVATFKVRLSDESDVSLTQQIVAQVEQGIATGQLKTGDRLLTVRSLAEELDVAPGTVARAYAELEKRGAVKTNGARGTTVAERVSAAMDAKERVMMLSTLLRPVAVEGFHVGATPDEMREALARAIHGVKLDSPDDTV